ncbi:MAG: RsmD family RNA methyltransferase [Flavobacteriales bacterium]|nr:RsmD family RNA methyltransferase [Flavobacteriales bacterium]
MKQVEEFILLNLNKSSAELSLILSKKPDLPKDYILNQINGRKKAKSKFPSLFDYPNFEFPSPKSVSQASSEFAAIYKASLYQGQKLADLSGGMGIDAFFFSKQFKHIDYVEQEPKLFKISQNNFKVLAATNIQCHLNNAHEFLLNSRSSFDCIFVDPDRRASKTKAFKIEDCEPNLKTLLPLIWEKSKKCVVKLSPMLDIKQALKELPYCKKVHVVSVKNDCKELLFELEFGNKQEALISCVNIENNHIQTFDFKFSDEENCRIEFHDVQKYILDPNSSILKAGAFKVISKESKIYKLAQNTHLYTSESIIPNFNGRQFKIIEEIKLKKGTYKEINVISKNYPLNTAQIKSKFKIKDGGMDFLIAFSDLKNQKRIFRCEKILQSPTYAN